MPPSAEPATRLLAEWGFERILDLPALPAANRTEHGYATAIDTAAGENWSLRSFGTEFCLVARPWLRAGLSRCYSLGWGLTAAGQSNALLLAQAFEPDEASAAQLGDQLETCLGPFATQLVWLVSRLWERPCLRFAADLGRSQT
jgi:hypothetical protein